MNLLPIIVLQYCIAHNEARTSHNASHSPSSSSSLSRVTRPLLPTTLKDCLHDWFACLVRSTRCVALFLRYFFLPCLYPLRVFVALSTSLRRRVPSSRGTSGTRVSGQPVPFVLYSRYKASLYRLPGKHNRLVCTFSLFFF